MNENLPQIGSTIYLKKGIRVFQNKKDGLTPLGPSGRKSAVVVTGVGQDAQGKDIILYSNNTRAIYA